MIYEINKAYIKANNILVDLFCRNNVVVYGVKGRGKDLLFAHVIYLRGDIHYSNMLYNENTVVAPLSVLSCGANTFRNFVSDEILPFADVLDPGCDYYITDGGVYLPAHECTTLNKLYPGMPLYFALSRQLRNHNVHVNCQYLLRLWDKLREQSDVFIRVLDREDKGDNFVVTCTVYFDYNAAVQRLNAGDCKEAYSLKFRVYKKELRYDTHYFGHKLLTNYPIESGDELFRRMQRV